VALGTGRDKRVAFTAVASTRCRARRSPLASAVAAASVVAGTWLWIALLEVVPFRETTVEGGGAERAARQFLAINAMIRLHRQHLSCHVGNSVWVDHTGPSASEQLENELMSMKIGGKTGKDAKRLAMRARRLAKQQELELKEEKHENAMLRWADRPAAITSPTQLEEELTKMEIGHIGGLEGHRGEVRLQRRAGQQALDQAAQLKS